MKTAIGQSADRIKISLPQKKQSQSSNVEWRTKQMLAMAEIFREPLTAECMAMYVESLSDLTDDQIRLCIARAIRELKWFPKPAELRELVGCNPRGEHDAEARAAWDVVVDFADKYIQSDPQGCYVVDQGVRRAAPPVLSQCIPVNRLLSEMPCLQLVAKPMNARQIPEPKQEQPEALTFKPKSIPEPLTGAQLRDRRELLMQQLASLTKRGSGDLGTD